MALPAYLPTVQGSHYLLGSDAGQVQSFLVNPGSADYVVGGYSINNIMVRARLICEAHVVGMNAQASGFWPELIFPIEQLASTILAGGAGVGPPYSQTLGAGYTGYSSFNFKVYENNTTSGRFLELSTNYDLIGTVWMIRVRYV